MDTRRAIHELLRVAGFSRTDELLKSDRCIALTYPPLTNVYDPAVMAWFWGYAGRSGECPNGRTEAAAVQVTVFASRNKSADEAFTGIFKVVAFGNVTGIARAYVDKKNVTLQSDDGKCTANLRFQQSREQIGFMFDKQATPVDLVVMECRLIPG